MKPARASGCELYVVALQGEADPSRYRDLPHGSIDPVRAGRIVDRLRSEGCAEMDRHLPVYGEAVVKLAQRIPHLRLLVVVAPAVDDVVSAAVSKWSLPVRLARRLDEKFDAFAASDAALAVSGTVALELALSVGAERDNVPRESADGGPGAAAASRAMR